MHPLDEWADLHISEVFGWIWLVSFLIYFWCTPRSWPLQFPACARMYLWFIFINVCCNQKVLDLKTQTFEVNNPVCPRSVFWCTSREAGLAEVKSVSGCSVCIWATAVHKAMTLHGSTVTTTTTRQLNNLMTAAKIHVFPPPGLSISK